MRLPGLAVSGSPAFPVFVILPKHHPPMPGIDPHTLVIVVSFQCLLLSCILAAMRVSFPSTIGGIGQWAAAMPLFVVASAVNGLPRNNTGSTRNKNPEDPRGVFRIFCLGPTL